MKIGYARCSTDEQDLIAQIDALTKLGVDPDHLYTDPGHTGTNRDRPGLREALAMVAEFEAGLIRARTREGMAVAKAKGRLKGKKPKLPPGQEKRLVELFSSGEHTVGKLAEDFGVSRATVYRAVERAGTKSASWSSCSTWRSTRRKGASTRAD